MNYRHTLVLIASLAAVSGCDQMQSGSRTDTGNTATAPLPLPLSRASSLPPSITAR